MFPNDTSPDRQLGWSDLVASPARRLGLWGLGVEGEANLARARSLGLAVVLVDQARAGETIDGLKVSADTDALFGCDVVIKSPGISRYQDLVTKLEEAGIAVVGGHGLWLVDADPNRVAVVTGTKGKSTTVSVVGHLFDGLGIDGDIGGNLGSPPYDPARTRRPRFWCLELSSYQVTDLTIRPRVAAITSLSPDHVEWHGNLDTYYGDKLALSAKPLASGVDPTDAVVLLGQPGGELDTRHDRIRAGVADSGGGTVIEVEADERSSAVAEALGLRGAHNRTNVAVALAVIESLTDERFSTGELVKAAAGFTVLSSRLSTVATVDGVEYVDDCLSTNTLPTIAALDVFADRPTALIVGGFDRGIDYAPLGRRLALATGPTLVLALDEPDNGPTILEAIRVANPSPSVELALVQSLEEGVERGSRWCRSLGGGVVLLSPAAPTRGQVMGLDGKPIPTRYPSYKAKSAAFAELLTA